MTRIDSQPLDFYTAAVDRMIRGRRIRMMLSKSSLRALIAVVLAVGGLSAAAAQTGGANDGLGASLPAADTKGDSNLTPIQMRAAANQYLPTMEQSAQTIRRQLEQ